jgi:hypothetical protein
MIQIALLLEPREHGADGGFLQPAAEASLDDVGAHRSMLPDQIQNLALKIAQIRNLVAHNGYPL